MFHAEPCPTDPAVHGPDMDPDFLQAHASRLAASMGSPDPSSLGGVSDVGSLIRAARYRRKMSRVELAEAAQVSPTLIAVIENGFATADDLCADHLLRLARAVALPTEYLRVVLLGGIGPDGSPPPTRKWRFQMLRNWLAGMLALGLRRPITASMLVLMVIMAITIVMAMRPNIVAMSLR